jgi:threonyl-tRNA synthetase
VDYAKRVEQALLEQGLRVETDDRSETLGFKVREAETQKVPLMLVIGDQEEQAGTVTPRLRRGAGKAPPAQALNEIVTQLAEANRSRRPAPFA